MGGGEARREWLIALLAKNVFLHDLWAIIRDTRPESRRGSRSVPMVDRVAGELERHFQRSAFQADDDLVFAHPHTGKVLDHSVLVRRYKPALRGPLGCARCASTTCSPSADCTLGTVKRPKSKAKRKKARFVRSQSIAAGSSISDTAPVDLKLGKKPGKHRKHKK